MSYIFFTLSVTEYVQHIHYLENKNQKNLSGIQLPSASESRWIASRLAVEKQLYRSGFRLDTPDQSARIQQKHACYRQHTQ
ncbi:hypothetical protein XELAEV_18013193mg [Xenopus laevis]|uniref:Uncharacterized protein n=1 Tax=Xenopus laevis TaxID=8355 RepID=A0A974HYU6_XENLA|nr:hypothetical protein XELAEV_18013193mg [Xenopus laevis]